MKLAETKKSTCWGLALRYVHRGRTADPTIAGRYYDNGEWHGCCARTYRNREEARQAARRCRMTNSRPDGFKVLLTPIRLKITVEEIR